jgi:hypothetical protein
MTEGFWLSTVNGTFIPEYPVVQRQAGCSSRWVDALILPDGAHRRGFVSEVGSLEGREAVVVQTKRGRMGMYLMGQAVFSARLCAGLGAASVRSILLCHQTDSALLPLLAPFPEVEVWVSDRNDPMACRQVSTAPLV